MGKLTYWSAGGAIRRTIHTDPDQPYRFVQETESVLPDAFFERNKALGETQTGDMKLVARAPVHVYEQSLREEWGDAEWAKWLNDPDNAAFRVWPGRL